MSLRVGQALGMFLLSNLGTVRRLEDLEVRTAAALGKRPFKHRARRTGEQPASGAGNSQTAPR